MGVIGDPPGCVADTGTLDCCKQSLHFPVLVSAFNLPCSAPHLFSHRKQRRVRLFTGKEAPSVLQVGVGTVRLSRACGGV